MPEGYAPRARVKSLRQIGILTPAQSDDTDAFYAFQHELHHAPLNWVEGENISLHFRFSKGDNGILRPLASQLFDIPVEAIVADGTNALKEAQAEADFRTVNIPIVQAVGGEKPTAVNHAGFYFDVVEMSKKQINKLHDKRMTDVTILHDTSAKVSPDPYALVKAYAEGKGMKVHEVLADTPADLQQNLQNKVVGSFMLIPNGMYFNNCEIITKIVDDALTNDVNLWAVYPEQEYKKAHANKSRVRYIGHHIPNTFKKAAHHLDDILRQRTFPTVSPAEDDVDPTIDA